MQPILNPALTAPTISCLAGLCRVWRGLLPGAKHDRRRIRITDSEFEVEGSDQRLSLNDEERDLLALFLENRGTVFTPETILSRLWWPDRKLDRQFVDATVASLNALLQRAGFAQGMIESFHDVGYRLRPEDETR
jgi:two-component system alkaline phosphatase synthesis response regulator PhoP